MLGSNICLFRLFFVVILLLSTSFASAASGDFAELLRDIQDGKIDVNDESDHDSNVTPLMIAALTNDRQSVKILLNMGADPDQKKLRGLTALMLASNQENGLGIVKKLLAHDSDPNLANANGQTALMLAANKGYGDIVDALLSGGARYDQVDLKNRTALFYASRGDHLEVVEKLLESMHDTQETIWQVRCAIKIARKLGHRECKDILKHYQAEMLSYQS